MGYLKDFIDLGPDVVQHEPPAIGFSFLPQAKVRRINKCRRIWLVMVRLLGGELSTMGTADQESKDGISIHSSI